MRPGPAKIVACPQCKALAKYGTLISGNTFGAEVWTDGLQIAPMLPCPPEVAKCNECSHLFWLKNANSVGELSWAEKDRAPTEWCKAEYLKEPMEADYYTALAGGLAQTAEQERTARVLAWWKSNEPLREQNCTEHSWSDPDARQANLESLLPLLNDHDESDRIMKAEVLRELGRFDEAMATLATASSPNYSPVVEQLQRLCSERDVFVKRLDMERAREKRTISKHKPWWKFW
jgi:hypothetical protein